MRYAIIEAETELSRVERFLPSNYTAQEVTEGILLTGTDSAGWTLDGYVIPRLASGLIFAREVAQPSTAVELVRTDGSRYWITVVDDELDAYLDQATKRGEALSDLDPWPLTPLSF